MTGAVHHDQRQAADGSAGGMLWSGGAFAASATAPHPSSYVEMEYPLQFTPRSRRDRRVLIVSVIALGIAVVAVVSGGLSASPLFKRQSAAAPAPKVQRTAAHTLGQVLLVHRSEASTTASDKPVVAIPPGRDAEQAPLTPEQPAEGPLELAAAAVAAVSAESPHSLEQGLATLLEADPDQQIMEPAQVDAVSLPAAADEVGALQPLAPLEQPVPSERLEAVDALRDLRQH